MGKEKIPFFQILPDEKNQFDEEKFERYVYAYSDDERRVTDYAILNGAVLIEKKYYNDSSFTSPYWMSDVKLVSDGSENGHYLQGTSNGFMDPTDTSVGIRPGIEFSRLRKSAKIVDTNRVWYYDLYDEVYSFEYGEYPKSIVNEHLDSLLDILVELNRINKTGRSFSQDLGNPVDGMKLLTNDEYEYNGNRYVKVKNLNPKGILSNNTFAGDKEYYWCKVEPVIWLAGKWPNSYAMTENVIIGGVAYNDVATDDFTKTYSFRFINDVFMKEMRKKVTSSSVSVKKEKEEKEEKSKVFVK